MPEIFLIQLCGRVGSKEISAEDLGEKFNVSPKAIQKMTGVTKLFKFGSEESLVSVSAHLARKVLVRSGLELKDINGVFASSNSTTKTLMPGYAALVATELGLRHVLADQVGMGCGGGLQALRAAYDRLIVNALEGKKAYYLVFAGDAVNMILNDGDRNTGLLFSEGASVALVTNDADFGKDCYKIVKINTKSHLGSGIQMMTVMNEFHPEVRNDPAYAKNRGFRMDGKGVFQFGSEMISHFLELVEEKEFKKNWMMFSHQPNLRMLEEMARLAGVPKKQIYMEGIQTIGNVPSASPFLGLQDGLRRNLFDVTNTVLLGAFGAELTVGAALLEPIGNPTRIIE